MTIDSFENVPGARIIIIIHWRRMENGLHGQKTGSTTRYRELSEEANDASSG